MTSAEQLWLTAVISFIVTAGLLPLILMLARRWRLFDPPGTIKIHTAPIPRLGGVAIGLGIVLGVASHGGGPALSLWVALAFVVVWTTGVIDDLSDLPPWIRLAAQVGAGLALWQAGWGLTLTSSPLANFAISTLYLLGFINAFNFLDGADGIAAGVAAVIAIGYLGLQALSLTHAVSGGVLGACLAFLIFNFPPARIFMGDGGSTVLGFTLAFLGLEFAAAGDSAPSRVSVTLICAALPILDMIFAVVRRVLVLASPFTGDRRHFYDLLLARGMARRRVAAVSYGVTAVCVLVGLCWTEPSIFIPCSGALLVALALAGVYLGSFQAEAPGAAVPLLSAFAKQPEPASSAVSKSSGRVA